jgi:hypothetical protein
MIKHQFLLYLFSPPSFDFILEDQNSLHDNIIYIYITLCQREGKTHSSIIHWFRKCELQISQFKIWLAPAILVGKHFTNNLRYLNYWKMLK